uniref:CDAN1-interacting nuclease 1 n=1 Tax=Eubosmina coregoni TaxID=186181 RepID=A0A4Y7LRF5_9CRUS|nr:EOG090X0A0V [Eubosmina coregoni]SVE69939.1 EOG090X0A0V [Eubosmina coregoni]
MWIKLNSSIISFKRVCFDTIKCIVAQYCQQRMKMIHSRLTSVEAVEDFYSRFQNAVSNGEDKGILLKISDEVGLNPALMARAIIERHYQKPDKSKPSRQLISSLMKNTALIENEDLAFEAYLCLLDDDEYGPIADAAKQSLGNEYEIRLRMELTERKLSFLHEDHLRMKGYDKTPDIKLEIPVGNDGLIRILKTSWWILKISIDGQVINWIESKALFGDHDVHRGYLNDQLYSYWNRFGPGLVIYWFGHVTDLEKFHQKRTILIRHELPSNITQMINDHGNLEEF